MKIFQDISRVLRKKMIKKRFFSRHFKTFVHKKIDLPTPTFDRFFFIFYKTYQDRSRQLKKSVVIIFTYTI